MTIKFLDPTHEAGTSGFSAASRLSSLKGATIAIVSNGKRGTRPFFDAVEQEFKSQHGVSEVVRLTKNNYSAPVEAALLEEAEKWQALIAGVGD